jgi:hypothetical protein
VRLKFFNQGPIDPDLNSNRDHACAENFSIGIRLQILNQSLPGIFESGSGFKYNFENNTFEQKYGRHNKNRTAEVHRSLTKTPAGNSDGRP